MHNTYVCNKDIVIVNEQKARSSQHNGSREGESHSVRSNDLGFVILIVVSRKVDDICVQE